MPVTQADLPRYRAVMERTMLDMATVQRTSVQVKARVSLGRTPHRFEGLPRAVTVPTWRLIMPYNTDVKAGDRVTVVGTGAGTYYVQDADAPFTLEAAVVCHCLRIDNGTGLPLPTNAVVTFRNPRSRPAPLTMQVPVILHDVSMNLQTWPDKPAGYEWLIVWDQNKRYADSALPDEGHEVTWTDGFGRTRTGLMTKPRTMTDILPYASAWVKENPS